MMDDLQEEQEQQPCVKSGCYMWSLATATLAGVLTKIREFASATVALSGRPRLLINNSCKSLL